MSDMNWSPSASGTPPPPLEFIYESQDNPSADVEALEQEIGQLKRKMMKQQLEFKESTKRMKKQHEEMVGVLRKKADDAVQCKNDFILEHFQLIDKLTDKIECPVCFEVPRSGPLPVCPNGHLVCSTCKRGKCPSCRANMGQGKSLLALTIIESINHKCKFDDCTETFCLNSLETHEKICSHRTVMCPDLDCIVNIPLARLVEHLMSSPNCCADTAPIHLTASPISKDRKNFVVGQDGNLLATMGWPMHLYSFDGQNFVVFPTKYNGQYFFMLVMFATRAKCDQYKMEVTVHEYSTEASESEASFTFRGNPLSIDQNKAEMKIYGMSEVFMRQILKMDDEQSFNISFKISRK